MTTFGPKDADAWYERNKHKLGPTDDPVMDAILVAKLGRSLLASSKVLEFGCANGWRLERIEDTYKCHVLGIELSEKAKQDAKRRLKIYDTLSSFNGDHAYRMNMIIHGFNLYLEPPENLLKVAYETDGWLLDGGYLIIHDFLPDHPYSRIYEHNKDLRSRKMDHALLWLAHPAYSVVYRKIYGEGDDRAHVAILKKDMANAFPLKETS